MDYDLIVKPEAEEDLTEIFVWYEKQRKGLGHDFLLQVEAGFRFIEKNPLALSKKYKETRRHIVQRFPYAIIYLVEGSKVFVLGVVHGGRDPNWIKKRIKKFI